jgi:Spy/CpxP family protein refolding chaperone
VKIKLLIGVLVALIVLNLATIGSFLFMQWRSSGREVGLWTQEGRPVGPSARRGHEGRRRPPRFRLSEEERDQLMSLLVEFRSETEGLRQKISEDENRVFELMRREQVPRAQVDSLLEEITRGRLESGRLAIDKLVESKAYLSPEQQKLFFDAILQVRPHDGMRRGWHGQMRGDRRGERRDDERF